MDSNLRTLGPAETKVVLTFREKGRTVVRAADVREILGAESTTRKVIHNLIRKGWLSRIVGGKYMLLPPEHGPENLGENNILALAAAAVEPSYIGWWSAASWHGFTTQRPTIVFVAVTKQTPPKVIEGSHVRFVAITARKFFGFKSYDIYGRSVALSTPAKTLIDCLDRPDLAGGPTEVARIAHSALGELEPKDVLATAATLGSRAVMQRLGFIADMVGKPFPAPIRNELRDAIPHTYRANFGRAERREGDVGYVAEWGLYVNIRLSDLLAEIPHRRPTREPDALDQ
jgi:predicted transcriptional regulator of viral defense system